jgi:hypothetical protein
MVRRDKRGRRIGHNPWRDYVTDTWRCAHHAWWLAMEAACVGYATEEREWRAVHPCPRLGDFMVELSPSWGTSGRMAA